MSMLKGKIALVTGASRGIGRGIALRLAQDGAIVVVHYGKNYDAAEEVVREIQHKGGSALTLGADLNIVNGVHDLYAGLDEALEKHTGGNQFDILVNNAGIGQGGTIEETTEQSFDEVLSLNVKAPLFLIQQALPRLRDEGRIINISSAVTRLAFPNFLGYSISKGALNTLTFVLAQHLGNRSITVNAILPGIIDTDMNAGTLQDPGGQKFAAGLSPFNRWGQPEDVADIAAFLASSDSRWITGQLIDASGGSHI
ncbi:SDR family oxidoreductase [Paenibacillus alginolyticus]|uniref:SDR family oxidoreductase n=1 Tax=Paenibacillus alginolyticus TaxID=59839 RepID=A0ABT4GJJ2_9BACL|nr:SDR family oxidoreductase [Paenibacillus alginolyticus]MCY9665917.1 SDR family oxidoreductase [Paenibacillus alginolyticus]MCY9696361.1 SDR family oxidoreductase [Paenibacillus alginolyticus]MEC0147795.1 SDR family oxidoreductase [Paenibacillus alginolyticus]